jgi:hypothetical protein
MEKIKGKSEIIFFLKRISKRSARYRNPHLVGPRVDGPLPPSFSLTAAWTPCIGTTVSPNSPTPLFCAGALPRESHYLCRAKLLSGAWPQPPTHVATSTAFGVSSATPVLRPPHVAYCAPWLAVARSTVRPIRTTVRGQGHHPTDSPLRASPPTSATRCLPASSSPFAVGRL